MSVASVAQNLLEQGGGSGSSNVYTSRIIFNPNLVLNIDSDQVLQLNLSNIPYNAQNIFLITASPSTGSLSFTPPSIFNFANNNNGTGGTAFRCNVHNPGTQTYTIASMSIIACVGTSFNYP